MTGVVGMARMGRKRVYKSCENAAAHRKAQAAYVAKNPAAQRARVKRSEAKHPAKAKAKAASKGKGKGGGSGPVGRPRKCK
jgi:hypothetical protein